MQQACFCRPKSVVSPSGAPHRLITLGYIFTWQSNVEVEEEIQMGRTRLWHRIGATKAELRHTRRDIISGMLFANVIMYFI
jgi:hypothetical protein